jgi:small ligand-binding sensory domain FIST
MQDFTLAHAAGGDWAQLAKSCADQIEAQGGRGNLGFLYLTDLLAEDMGSVLTFMRERTGIEHWVGTVGLGICVTGKEYFDQPAVAAMTVALPEDAFRMLPEMDDESDIVGLAEAGAFDGFTPGIGIVHGDPRNPNTREIVGALAETRSCYLVGGLASSRGEFGLIADRVFDGGLSGVVLSAEVPVVVGLSQGCKLFGPSHTVTACEDNIVIELDGESALEVLLNDIDPPVGEDLDDSLTDIHAAVPVQGSDTGDYLVRNLMGVDPEQGWIAIAENAEPGDQLMFCRRDAASAAQDLKRMLGDLKRRANGSPRGGIYFSCVGRGPNLFGRESAELAIIRAELGDFPLVGFFGNGEISHDRLYGYTGILTLFT